MGSTISGIVGSALKELRQTDIFWPKKNVQNPCCSTREASFALCFGKVDLATDENRRTAKRRSSVENAPEARVHRAILLFEMAP